MADHGRGGENKLTIIWSNAFKNKKFAIAFYLTLAVVLSFSFSFKYFFDFIESRKGTQLNDFIVNSIPGKDVSFFVFFFLYSGLLLFIVANYDAPRILLTALQTYVLVTLTRMISITILPLEPPIGYIPLKEPFVQLFTTDGKIISKDLFFSGHVSTILSVFFAARKPWLKRYLLLACIMIGSGVMIQHVHYMIDVLVALPATFFWYFVSKRFLNSLSKEDI